MAKIFINKGHAPDGKPDPGACNRLTGLRECDVVHHMGDLVAFYLRAVGHEVMVMQCDSLSEVVAAANAWGADLFVSIHCNSFTTPIPSGAETWYWYTSAKGKKLANCIQQQIVNSLPVVNRGLKLAQPQPPQNNLYVLRCTDMPAALVETAFISNPGDERLLADPARRDDFARAMSRGITDYVQEEVV